MQFFQWIASNWQAVCGWAGGLYLTYHFCRLLVALVLAINSVVKQFKSAYDTLIRLTENHLPHIQAELEKTNRLLADMCEDLKKVVKAEEYETT